VNGVVLIRLAGPMQSWGTRSRFIHRDTETEPTKSGVVGLIACAMGRPRGEDLSDLANMAMTVRVDSPGHLEVDYQTALHVVRADGSKNAMAVQSWRHYLADARFLVALSGDMTLCESIRKAFASPRWPLFLGRKGYVASEPFTPHPVVEEEVLTVLARTDWPTEAKSDEPLDAVDLWVECGPGETGDTRMDVPVNFAIDSRQYRSRRVRRERLARALPVASESADIAPVDSNEEDL